IGNYSDGYYEVLSGIKLNDKIVTSGQFMIDSESNLRSAINLLSTNAEAKTAEMSDAEMKNMDSAENSNLEEHNHDNSIVHDGNIDLEAIDKNNDGKVFQDPMDWNVISDKAGRCPICNMILEEVSINEAKKNLKENGFEYK
ncbi:MAG: efflux RND transporter periplasmic adaptor subunit, partial [Ignavibacteriae bacterium]|nr:efflux RND transporter periplasmic adaptor subunit [Ignavibacteriota bacterium]